MRYAVTYTDRSDNDLRIKIVEADNWEAALSEAVPHMAWLKANDLFLAPSVATIATGQFYAVIQI